MVTVTNYQQRTRKDGTTFITLEITGGLEIVQSSNTGNFYATVRKCNIPSTFNEAIAQIMIGQQMQGDVVRVEADPYEFVNQRTGEVMILNHTYAYRPQGSQELIGHTRVEQLQPSLTL
jgi:hypothetical protein